MQWDDSALVEADLVYPPQKQDWHPILSKGKAIGAGGEPAIDMDLHLGVIIPLIDVVSNNCHVGTLQNGYLHKVPLP